jgi:Protein of unknown function with HXXEE motif
VERLAGRRSASWRPRTRARRRPSFRRAVWLFPPAFALHVLEEAPGFTDWARRHASDRYTQRDFVRNNAAGMAMAIGETWLVSRFPNRAVVFAYFASLLSQQVPFNAAFHAGTTVAFRTYSPGLVTSLAQLPLWWRLMRLARREDRLSGRAAAWAAGIGGLIHTAAVADQVFFVRADSRMIRR